MVRCLGGRRCRPQGLALLRMVGGFTRFARTKEEASSFAAGVACRSSVGWRMVGLKMVNGKSKSRGSRVYMSFGALPAASRCPIERAEYAVINNYWPSHSVTIGSRIMSVRRVTTFGINIVR